MIYLCLILGLFLLFYGGDKLVEGSVAVARHFKISTLLIGLTFVGFGTSTPELITSILAVYEHSAGIAVGNIVGSNIVNILLVLGVAAVIRPVSITLSSFKRDSFFLIVSTLVLILAFIIGHISPILGGSMVSCLIGYVVFSYYAEKKPNKGKDDLSYSKDSKLLIWGLGKAILGISLTLLGAKLLVDNSIKLATLWGVSENIVGLTIVAVGTSLPELATSIMAAIRKENDVAFGNVVGSNIFNALFILGITALFMPVKIPSDMAIDLAIMTLTTALLILIGFLHKRYSRCTGIIFMMLYALYIIYLGSIS